MWRSTALAGDRLGLCNTQVRAREIDARDGKPLTKCHADLGHENLWRAELDDTVAVARFRDHGESARRARQWHGPFVSLLCAGYVCALEFPRVERASVALRHHFQGFITSMPPSGLSLCVLGLETCTTMFMLASGDWRWGRKIWSCLSWSSVSL